MCDSFSLVGQTDCLVGSCVGFSSRQLSEQSAQALGSAIPGTISSRHSAVDFMTPKDSNATEKVLPIDYY